MPVVDLIVGGLIAAAAVAGLMYGLARAMPLAGFAVGAVLGSRLPLLFGVELHSEYAIVVALPAALLVGAFVAALVERWAGRAARLARRHPRANVAGGGFVAGAAAVVAIWLLAPMATELRSLRGPVQDSEVLSRLNAVLTAAGPRNPKELPPIDNFPRFAGRLPSIGAADPRVVSAPAVAAATLSVAKIVTTTCEGHGTGSGWVAARGIVATNAHVVAGSERISVRLRNSRSVGSAVPVWFDRVNDLALLRVAALRRARVLPMVRTVRPGTAGAVLGFPRGNWGMRSARIGPTTDRLLGSIRGSDGVPEQLYGRRVTTVRGRTQPGNSGGPVVDGRGRVVATVFGGGVGTSTLAVPNAFVRTAVAKAGPRVSTGPCEED